MTQDSPKTEVPLVASPYDLRVSLGEHVGESPTTAALKSGDLGFVHSFTTGSAVDGPGMRVVVWLTGCQFRCVFCHNPDTWKLNNGIPVPLARAVEEVRKYRHGLRTMQGGLTVSGGEPLLQDRFLIRLFTAVKETKIHTTVDTNGYFGDRLSDADLQACDLVMLGLKALDPDLHRRITGMDNAPVLAFARRLAALRRPMWLRYVLVPGLYGRRRRDQADRRVRRRPRQRRAGRAVAVPPTRPLQVGTAGNEIRAARHGTAFAGANRAGDRRVSLGQDLRFIKPIESARPDAKQCEGGIAHGHEHETKS